MTLYTILNINDHTSNTVLSNGNLTLTAFKPQTLTGLGRAVDNYTSGKFYFEATVTGAMVGLSLGLGICTATAIASSLHSVATGGAIYLQISGDEYEVYCNGTLEYSSLAAGNGTNIGIAVDLTNQLIWFRGFPTANWNNNSLANPATGTDGIALPFSGIGLYPVASTGINNSTDQVITFNFGASAFAGVVPSGFTAGWPQAVPTVPTGLSLTGATSSSFIASWNVATDNIGPITYTLQYRETGTLPWTQVTGLILPTTVITGLVALTEYDFQIEAVNYAGGSGFSATVNATTLAQSAGGTYGPIPLFPVLPVGFPVKVTPSMSTVIGTTKAGREMRVPQRQVPLWEMEIPFQELKDQTQNQTPYAPFVGIYQYEILVENWLMMYGQTNVFYFDCPWDDSRSNQQIGIGDGTTYAFTVNRTWGLGSQSILESVGGVNTVFQVQVNGVTVPSTDYYTVRNQIIFEDIHGTKYPPGNGLPITMTFSFYYLCRFLEDEEDFEEFAKNRWTVRSLKFRSVNWP